MIKKTIKYLFILVALFSVISFNVYAEDETNEETTEIVQDEKEKDYYSYIEDDANILNESEKVELSRQMEFLTNYGHFLIKTISTNPEESTAIYAEKYYQQELEDDNGTIVLIDMDKKESYIYSKDRNYEIINESEATRILENVSLDFRHNQYYKGLSKVINEIRKLLNPTETIEDTVGDYKIIIEDDAALFTQEEIEKLKDKMSSITEYGNIALKTIPVGENSYSSTSLFADNYYHSKFGTESGSVLVIDMDKRMIYIFSDGYNYSIITNSKADIITDNIYRYATNEDYYSCAYNAFDQMYTILDGGKINEPMRHISNIFLAILSAFFINFLVVVSKSKIKKADAREVLNNCDISCEAKDIKGTKTGQRRQYSPQSSGGSSGGGGGGGGSSGGGGGHSF